MRKRIAIAGAIIGTTAGIGISRTVRTWRTWGIDPLEANKPLAGDELVPVPSAVETRAITIDAPPAAVWPWLVQMGYGRGGWYSYDQLDMRGTSATKILPEYQAIAVGDIVPTSPTTGFDRSRGRAGPRPRAVQRHGPGPEPGGSRRGRRQGRASHECPPVSPPRAHSLAGRRRNSPPAGPSSLEPLDGGRTRLIERSACGSTGRAGVPSDRPGHGLRRLHDGAPPATRHPRAGRADGRRTSSSSGPRSRPTRGQAAPAPRTADRSRSPPRLRSSPSAPDPANRIGPICHGAGGPLRGSMS